MRALAVVAAVLATVVALPGGGSAHIGCAGTDIRFRAGDGTRLVAHRYGTGRTFVVLAHQSGGSLCQWYPYSKRLTALGYSSLAFDFRGYGESQARRGAAANRLELDVTAAAALARRLGARKVFLVGASMGGWAVLRAAPDLVPAPAGVVSLSAPPQYKGDVFPFVRRLTLPVLYLASAGEGLTAETQALFDATASEDKTMRLVSGSAHGVDLLDPTLGKPGWRTARTLVQTFLRQHATS